MRGNISTGAGYLIRGARLLKHPSLRAFVIIPLLINIVVFGSLLGYAIISLAPVLEQWINAIPDWLSFLRWLVWPVVFIALALISGYFFTAVAILIAAPFNTLLAEKAEELVSGKPVAGLEGLRQALTSFPRSLWREWIKLLYYLPLLLVVLVLTFIPGLNSLSPVLWFLLGAWMMAVQYVDYPVDNHQLGFSEVKALCRHQRLSSLGFGGLVALVSGIPVLNFFVVPAAVVGATIYWHEELCHIDRGHDREA